QGLTPPESSSVVDRGGTPGASAPGSPESPQSTRRGSILVLLLLLGRLPERVLLLGVPRLVVCRQFLQLLGVLRRQVGRLGHVLGQVEQPRLVLVDPRRHQFPVAFADRPLLPEPPVQDLVRPARALAGQV